jgi:hypothetical protein
MTSGQESVLALMKLAGVPVTRENYIAFVYGDDGIPEDWTPEHEAELPEELRRKDEEKKS